MRGWTLPLALLLTTSGVAAQEVPDPASFVVPDLSDAGTPAVVANGWKYFVFRKEGVSFAAAHADLADCFRFLKPTGWADARLPRFVPWRRSMTVETATVMSPYGLVGDLMLGAVEGTLARRDRQSRLRRCMEPRGYVRLGIAEATFEGIFASPPEQAIGILARIASGPDFGGKVPEK
ncbi:MAG: hypothetical protein ACMVO5_07805 [Polymorphobacter sp.]|uniref:hypothetical protein n=1 Tax=Polymorphobacter sp. TaxID=1909290 RepID=UPI003A880D3B